jgi:DNA-binding NtrC family response regulator
MAEKNRKKILVIDDEESIRDGCQRSLHRLGYQVDTEGRAAAGLEMATRHAYDVILLDVRMPEMSGLDILRKLKGKTGVDAKVIIITGHGTIPLTVEAMRLGAHNFLTKPFDTAELAEAVREALHPADQKPSSESLGLLIGNSDYMRELKETIRRLAETDSTVLITGESGTGKELVARSIHALSRRADKPFVPVDCASLAESLMESELFGHIKGAFSGATESRDGRFQRADKGTLFLDEISNVSLTVQVKLLRVLQEQEVPRVGSTDPEKVDVRIIAATNRDLRAEVETGKFREDLFYRISVVPIEIQPLRMHKADILLIAQHYLDIYRIKHKSKVRSFSDEAKKSLLAYGWAGNIRELKNTVERLCVLGTHEVVNLSDILYYGQSTGTKAPVVDFPSGTMTLVDIEKEHIEKALQHFGYQINKTARLLGIDRKTLRMKIRNYGIEIKE